GALVEWAAGALARNGGGDPRVDRATARGRGLLARLRAACEQAKIELSRAERASIVMPDPTGDGIEGELEITRGDLEALTEPFIARSLAAVRVLLAKNQRTADDVARVVLVGGPTLMPGLRARVGEMFGGRRSHDHRRARRRAVRGQRRAGRDAGRARPRAGGGPACPHRAPVGDRRSGTVRRRPL